MELALAAAEGRAEWPAIAGFPALIIMDLNGDISRGPFRDL